LAETYARIVPITRKLIRAGAKAAPEAITQPAAKGRTEHGVIFPRMGGRL
jgi:hypothetical protein